MAILQGQTIGSVACLWSVWSTSHTNAFGFSLEIKCEFWFWAACCSSFEVLKGEIIPLTGTLYHGVIKFKMENQVLGWGLLQWLLAYLLSHRCHVYSCVQCLMSKQSGWFSGLSLQSNVILAISNKKRSVSANSNFNKFRLRDLDCNELPKKSLLSVRSKSIKLFKIFLWPQIISFLCYGCRIN